MTYTVVCGSSSGVFRAAVTVYAQGIAWDALYGTVGFIIVINTVY